MSTPEPKIPRIVQRKYWKRMKKEERKEFLQFYSPDSNERLYRLNDKETVAKDTQSLRRLLARVGCYRHEFTLAGRPAADSPSPDPRISFLHLMYDDSATRTRHFDELRQKYMNYALLIFAGLLTLGSQSNTQYLRYSASFTVTGLMVVFCALDRHLHWLSHQWQSHANLYYEMSCDALNNPQGDLSFDKWEREHAGPAEWSSFQPIIYYCLVGVSLLSPLLWALIPPTAGGK